MTQTLETLDPENIFAELRSACAHKNYEKAHHCIRWFLLYAHTEAAESALHYAVNTVREDMSNSYRWPWWLKFIRNGRRASLVHHRGQHFRIIEPVLCIIHE